MTDLPTIPEFFKNKTIFITGGSGFLGKVLVEKLLRSCPDLTRIYLLMRPKKGQTADERIKAITDLPLFDVLRAQNPSVLKKLRQVSGDVTQLGLGLNREDKKLLVEEVNVVLHGAASVRFDTPLTDAVLMNTRGTREVVNLALEMKQLNVLVHISTTYCNVDRPVIGEQLYPPHADWEKTIEIAETVDKHTLNVLTTKYVSPLPNTYTFTKSLAEHVVYDLTKGKIPTVIFRPSIVISTAVEPFVGWIDNFNGPTGLMVGLGKGLIRTVHCDPNRMLDYVPVDMVVKGILISAWKQATTKDPIQRLETSFYNGSNNEYNNITISELKEMGQKICWETPTDNVLWYPDGTVTKCYYNHFLKVIFFQLLPAIFIDGILKITGNKPRLVKIQRRIFNAISSLEYFTKREWEFLNDKSMDLENQLLPSDVEDWSYKKDEVDLYEFFKAASLGGKKFLLNESEDNLEHAKAHMKRMYLLHLLTTFLWYLTLFWILFYKIDIIAIVAKKYEDMCIYFSTD